MKIKSDKFYKTITISTRITERQLDEAFESTLKSTKYDTGINAGTLSVKKTYEHLRQVFTSLPVHTLLECAGLFEGLYTPADYMLTYGFAIEISKVVSFTKAEQRKPAFFITPSGRFFLEAVLYNFRTEIDNKIFYLS